MNYAKKNNKYKCEEKNQQTTGVGNGYHSAVAMSTNPIYLSIKQISLYHDVTH